jgi:hypothetical protein
MPIRVSCPRPPDEKPLGPAAVEVSWDKAGVFTPAERMNLVDRGFSPAEIGFLAACREVARICDESERRERERKVG